MHSWDAWNLSHGKVVSPPCEDAADNRKKKLKDDSSWISASSLSDASRSNLIGVKCKQVSFSSDVCVLDPICASDSLGLASCGAASAESTLFAGIRENFVNDFPRWQKVIQGHFEDTFVFDAASRELKVITERVKNLKDDMASCHSCLREYRKFDKFIAYLMEQGDDVDSD